MGWTVRRSNPVAWSRFSEHVQTGRGPTQPPLQCVLRLPGWAKQPGRDVDQLPPSSAEAKEGVELRLYPVQGLRGVFWG